MSEGVKIHSQRLNLSLSSVNMYMWPYPHGQAESQPGQQPARTLRLAVRLLGFSHG